MRIARSAITVSPISLPTSARRPPRTGGRSARRASAQILDALSFLHARGIVHRDLKLENVLVRDADGPLHVLLCDFGSARFSSTSATNGKAATAHVGTLPYMAPEQLNSMDDLDAGADIYSMGVTFWELL